MKVYRLVRKKYALPLSGKGAALKGGRWNSPGTELIYTAANRSLAMAEVAVHLSLATIPDDYVMMELDIPNGVSARKLKRKELPSNWNVFPYPNSTQKIGDAFVLQNKCCILIVPFAVTRGDYNILINPRHKDFKHIKVTDMYKFPFDRRIFRQL
ncbi:MAG: RES domain-containing protein [Chitinophagaceae bacterium]|nr:RES domain-containing protein [Chitinophagaceae bacterium]